jgi:2-hydroxychromene-2-carboxylate isomerase
MPTGFGRLLSQEASVTLAFDCYFSFRSPYSYLAVPQITQALERYDLAVRMRIVYPIAVRIPGFFKRVDPLWPPYLMRDTHRIAEMLGIPYRWPRPDPIVMDLAKGEVAAEQPYIHRVSRLGVLAAEAGRGFDFVRQVSRLIWSGETDNWHEDRHLAPAVAAAGLELTALDRQVEAEADRLAGVLEENAQAQRAAGHWGVPLFVFDGEPFFGQDRIEHLLWRMGRRGLSLRQSA